MKIVPLLFLVTLGWLADSSYAGMKTTIRDQLARVVATPEFKEFDRLTFDSKMRLQLRINKSELASLEKMLAKSWPKFELKNKGSIPGLSEFLALDLTQKFPLYFGKPVRLRKSQLKHWISMKGNPWEFSVSGEDVLTISARGEIDFKDLLAKFDDLTKVADANHLRTFKATGMYGQRSRYRVDIDFVVAVGSEKQSNLVKRAFEEKKQITPTPKKEGPLCNKYVESFSEPGLQRIKQNVEVSPSYRDALLTTQFTEVLQSARMVPYLEKKKMVGFKMAKMFEDSFFCKAGLLPGDIITRIDGVALTDASIAIKSLQKVRNANKVVIDGLRDGKPIQYVISVSAK